MRLQARKRRDLAQVMPPAWRTTVHSALRTLRQPAPRCWPATARQGDRDAAGPDLEVSSENLGAQGGVEAGPAAGDAHQQDAGPFEDRGHLESTGVEGPQVQALQEGGDFCFRLRAVAGEERVQRPPWARTWPKTVLNAFTTCALSGAAAAISWDIERPAGHQPGAVGVERVGDVDQDLAGQRIAVVRYRDHALVQDGEDDDVTLRRCAERADRGSAADLVGQCLSLGGVAAQELDGVAAFAARVPMAAAMLPEPMKLMVVMMNVSSVGSMKAG